MKLRGKRLDNVLDKLTIYTFRDYGIPLPREELKTVDCLRTEWKKLLLLAEKVNFLIKY